MCSVDIPSVLFSPRTFGLSSRCHCIAFTPWQRSSKGALSETTMWESMGVIVGLVLPMIGWREKSAYQTHPNHNKDICVIYMLQSSPIFAPRRRKRSCMITATLLIFMFTQKMRAIHSLETIYFLFFQEPQSWVMLQEWKFFSHCVVKMLQHLQSYKIWFALSV